MMRDVVKTKVLAFILKLRTAHDSRLEKVGVKG